MPIGAIAGAVGAVAGAVSVGKSIFGKKKRPTLTDPQTGGPLSGVSNIQTPGLSFSRSGGNVGVSRTGGFNPLAQENALRSRLSGLDPSSRLAGIGANRVGLEGIQTRSQALRGDVAALGGQQIVDQGAFGNLQSRFGALAGQAAGTDLSAFGDLRGDISQIRGGLEGEFGALAEAQRTAIRNARAQSVGNLRESLGRRGVLGSSFGQDALARQELEFGQAEGAAVADARVQQAVLSGQLAGLEGDILNSEISQSLARLALSGELTQAEQSSLRDQSSLALQEAAFKGQLFQLDAGLLQQQAQNIFISMGLTDQEAQVFSQQLSTIMSEAQLLQQTTTRQLQELGIAGNIANGVEANITSIANSNAELAIAAAKARGDAIAGAGDVFGAAGSALSSIFGSLFTTATPAGG